MSSRAVINQLGVQRTRSSGCQDVAAIFKRHAPSSPVAGKQPRAASAGPLQQLGWRVGGQRALGDSRISYTVMRNKAAQGHAVTGQAAAAAQEEGRFGRSACLLLGHRGRVGLELRGGCRRVYVCGEGGRGVMLARP